MTTFRQRSSPTLRRCPRCKTVGRMYRSHSRNAFERFMKLFSPALVLYRCHHCNWRGYMFRRFRSQSRFAFWMTLLGIATGGVAGVAVGWFLLVRFVELLLGR
ncbi:MAG: hypothetical protein NZ960_06240 [Candidatus Kapabacteria bacterium]|nr:hypothetical protein [Candidatus Kapabacteria bacterium]MDW8012575.1 hypothetical protein [Bacteroidota bacterium]